MSNLELYYRWVGKIFVRSFGTDDERYILAQVDNTVVKLVGLESGNRYSDDHISLLTIEKYLKENGFTEVKK